MKSVEAKKFGSFGAALAWAKIYAKESLLPFLKWEVVGLGSEFAVALVSKNSGELYGYCEA